MSVGNLNTQGDKKNNWTWQNAVLQLLGQIAAGGGGGGGGCCPATPRVPNMIRANAAGSVAAGKRSASFYNAGGVSATVLGAALLSGESVSFDAGSSLDTLPEIAYDATGTDLLITSIT